MIYRTSIPIDVSSADFTLPRACSALLIGSGGNLKVDMSEIKSAEAYVTVADNGTISAITLANPGFGYVVAPSVVIYGGAFRSNLETDAIITCTETNGQVNSGGFTISNAGTGYSKLNPPQVKFTGGRGTGITLAVLAGVLPLSVSKVYHAVTSASGLFALYV